MPVFRIGEEVFITPLKHKGIIKAESSSNTRDPNSGCLMYGVLVKTPSTESPWELFYYYPQDLQKISEKVTKQKGAQPK